MLRLSSEKCYCASYATRIKIASPTQITIQNTIKHHTQTDKHSSGGIYQMIWLDWSSKYIRKIFNIRYIARDTPLSTEVGTKYCRKRIIGHGVIFFLITRTLHQRANFTEWATAICRRNLVPTFVDRGVSRGQNGGSPTVVNLSFLHWSRYFSFK
jgi:hypothetical protein